MTIKKDAGELLVYFYKEKIKNKNLPQLQELISETKWESSRLGMALDYLIEKGFLKVQKFMGNHMGIQNMIIENLTTEGIDLIENEKEFQRSFSFSVNLGIFSYSWGATEK